MLRTTIAFVETSPRVQVARVSRSLTHKLGIFTRGPMLKHALVYLNRTADSAQSCLDRFLRADVSHTNRSPIYHNARGATQAPRFKWFRWGLVLLSVLHAGLAIAQSSLTDVVGIPTDAAIYPIPGVGFVNLANGNLHVEIPVRTVIDRNGKPVTTAITYDNSFWEWIPAPAGSIGIPNTWGTIQDPSGYSNPVNVTNSIFGSQVQSQEQLSKTCVPDGAQYRSNWTYTDPHGTIHSFPASLATQQAPGNSQCDIPAIQAAATDGSRDGGACLSAARRARRRIPSGDVQPRPARPDSSRPHQHLGHELRAP